jgi:uncharacterized RDD family membrane protein YckC
MDDRSSQSETVQTTLQYNVTGSRIVAALVDVVVLAVVLLAMAAAFGDLGGKSEDGTSSFSVSLSGAPFLLFLLVSLAYFVLLEMVAGATLGKMVLGLRVVEADGNPCDFGSAIVRNLVRIVDWLPILYVVGLISIAVSKKHQRLGDMAAGTVVVRSG